MPDAVEPPSDARLGPVHLRVVDVAEASKLWLDVVGLSRLGQAGDRLELGVGGRTLVTLRGGARGPAAAGRVGLFHVALELPSHVELARAASRLVEARRPFGGQDHMLTESIYLGDVDGNTIELYVPTPSRASFTMVDGWPRFVTPDGLAHSGVERLNIGALLGQLETEGPGDGRFPAAGRVGHVHFRSNRPEASIRFYRESFGLRPHIASAKFGMFDCGTERDVHMVAFNNWGGPGLRPPAPDAAGLIAFTLEVPAARMKALRTRLAGGADEEAGVFQIDDPDGNRIIVTSSPDLSAQGA